MRVLRNILTTLAVLLAGACGDDPITSETVLIDIQNLGSRPASVLLIDLDSGHQLQDALLSGSGTTMCVPLPAVDRVQPSVRVDTKQLVLGLTPFSPKASEHWLLRVNADSTVTISMTAGSICP